jgi:hypothetical protein
MASQSDARMFAELTERVAKIEGLLEKVVDKLQELYMQAGGGAEDLMPVIYPEPKEEAKEEPPKE